MNIKKLNKVATEGGRKGKKKDETIEYLVEYK